MERVLVHVVSVFLSFYRPFSSLKSPAEEKEKGDGHHHPADTVRYVSLFPLLELLISLPSLSADGFLARLLIKSHR